MKKDSIYFEKRDPQKIGDVFPALLRSMGLASGMNEHIVYSAWDTVTGAGPYTLNKYLKNKVLYCTISSSVVRNQLFFNKEAIIGAINSLVVADSLYSGDKNDKPVKSLILR